MTTSQRIFPVESKAPTAITRIIYDHRKKPASGSAGSRSEERPLEFSLDDVLHGPASSVISGRGMPMVEEDVDEGSNDVEPGNDGNLSADEENRKGPDSEEDADGEGGDQDAVTFVPRPKGSCGDLSRNGYTLSNVWPRAAGEFVAIKVCKRFS